MTAMVVLTANSMHKPQHDDLVSDKELVSDGLQFLDKMVEDNKCEVLRTFHQTCTELHQRVQVIA